MTQSCNPQTFWTRRSLIKTAATLAAGIAAPAVLRVGAAFAAYPERPIRILVANTPGGPSDIIARIMAAAMTDTIGGSVIVENKGGAGGNIGMGLVARSEPDGYTILLSTSAFSVNPGLYQNPVYDPFKDFVAVCELAVSPHVFAVKPDLAVYFRVPIDVSVDRLMARRVKLKFYEAGMDMGWSSNAMESFRIFQGKVLDEYDRLVDEFGLSVVNAVGSITEQQRVFRRLVSQHLEIDSHDELIDESA